MPTQQTSTATNPLQSDFETGDAGESRSNELHRRKGRLPSSAYMESRKKAMASRTYTAPDSRDGAGGDVFPGYVKLRKGIRIGISIISFGLSKLFRIVSPESCCGHVANYYNADGGKWRPQPCCWCWVSHLSPQELCSIGIVWNCLYAMYVFEYLDDTP